MTFPIDPNMPAKGSPDPWYKDFHEGIQRKPRTLLDMPCLTWLEDRRYKATDNLELDLPDPRDVALVKDTDTAIHDLVEDFTTNRWMSVAGANHARIILENFNRP